MMLSRLFPCSLIPVPGTNFIDCLAEFQAEHGEYDEATAALGMAQRDDTTDLLASVPCPSLVVVGRDDILSPPEEMRRMADRLPDSMFIVIEEAAHMTPLEKPEVFNTAVETFLAGLR